MCYSAQIQQAYARYVREWGAIIDIGTFVHLYGARAENPKVKIPKGMDFMLAEALGADEIRRFIAQFNAERIQSSEQDMFAQAKRLADAERKLALKETKAARSEQRIAGNKIRQAKRWIADAQRTTHEPETDDRIWPDWYAPVMIVENGQRVVKPMRYHCRPAGMHPSTDRTKDGKISGKYNARRDNLTKFWRNQFTHTHGLMLAEVFYENVETETGENAVIRFEPRTGETMIVACLWSHWADPTGKQPDLLSFAAITDEPEPEVAAAGHDRTIINIKREHVDAWLNPTPGDHQAMFEIFDDKRHPYYEHRMAA